MAKTQCTVCGGTSEIMRPGNGCHRDGCAGVMAIKIDGPAHEMAGDGRRYCRECGADAAYGHYDMCPLK